MSKKPGEPVGVPEWDEDEAESTDEAVGTTEGFASALCYLAFEAERAGWHETHEYLEQTYSTFLDEVGAVRARFRVYVNPRRH